MSLSIAALRAFAIILALAALAACGAVPRAAAPTPDVKFRIRDVQLKSGLRILVEEDHAAPIAGVVTVFGSGATADPPGKEGLAHLVEHLVFDAKHAPDQTLMSLFTQAGAGALNAHTALDETTYFAFGPKDAVADLFALHALLVQNPLVGVDQAAFALARDVVRNELRQRNEMHFMGQAFAELQRAVFPAGHGYARAIAGTHESLDTLTLDDARAFVRAHYRPDNATMVVAGDIDLGKVNGLVSSTLPASLAEGAHGPRKTPRLPPTAPPVPAPPAGAMRSITGYVPLPELVIAWSLPRGFDGSAVSAFMAQTMGDAIRGSLREDDDIVSTSVRIMDGAEASMLICEVVLREGKHPDVSFEHVLDRLAAAWAPLTERQQAREDIVFLLRREAAITRLYFEAEDLVGRAQERAALAHFTGDPAVLGRKLLALSNVHPDEATVFASRWVTRERARAVLVRPMPEGSPPPPSVGLRAESTKPSKHARVTYDIASIGRVAVSGSAAALHTKTLPNGLEVIIGHRGSVPVATAALVFHSGAANAVPLGMPELVLQAGTVGDARAGYALPGARVARMLSDDSMMFRVEVSAEILEQALAVLFAQVTTLHVTAKGLDAFRTRGLPRLKAAETEPSIVAAREFMTALRGPTRSTADDLGKLGTEDADRWIAQTLTPRNATLVVIGGIDEESVQRAIESSFGGWEQGAKPARLARPKPVPHERRVLVRAVPGASLATVRVGCMLPAPDQRHAIDAELVADIVERRLNAALRRDLGATYGVNGSATAYRGGTSQLVLATQIENAKLAQALARMRKELDREPREIATLAELDESRWNRAIRYNLRLARSGDLVSAVVDARTTGWLPGAVDEVPRLAASATPEALAETLTACQSGLVLSVAGDEPTIKSAVAASWASP